MSSMFEDCNSRILSTTNFNTSKVKDMSNMFRDNYDLEYLDISNFDTKNVITMASMFENCHSVVLLS